MSEQIFLREYRNNVDKTFVGFKPNGDAIKPVHVAGDAFMVVIIPQCILKDWL